MTPHLSQRHLALSVAVIVGTALLLGLVDDLQAQRPASLHRIGVLLVGYSTEDAESQAFREGIRDAGYTEGRDVVIEWRSANGHYDRVPRLATELVQRGVDVLVVESTVGALALKRATSTIPIVMAIIADPLGSGLVRQLSHPGENMTGLSLMATDLSAKRLELLKEAIPRATRIGVLWDPGVPWHSKVISQLKTAAPSLSIKLKFVAVTTGKDIIPAVAALKRARVQALYVVEGPFVTTHQAALLDAVADANLPAIYGSRSDAGKDGLMSYGANFPALMRQSVSYVDRILKGARPGDLPIEQPTTVELMINLRTARSLGLVVPESILLRANAVVQ